MTYRINNKYTNNLLFSYIYIRKKTYIYKYIRKYLILFVNSVCYNFFPFQNKTSLIT